jgi:pantoate--beta-alanine ligase
MAGGPPVARTVKALRRRVAAWREAGERVALVPTMGALHAGHLELVRVGRRRADRVVVSIFVNPAQFAPSEDFTTYPRMFTADRRALAESADLVFAPTVAEMYPEGFATSVVPSGAAAADLEDKFRPTHFQGVATVVAKLFTQAMPDVAVFGEKDYQQLRVVTRLARDLDLPLRVIGVPTVREEDGLAMSSRNRYLSAEERTLAALLPATLRSSAERIAAGRPVAAALAQGAARLAAGGFVVDYLDARHATTLAPVRSRRDGPIRLLVAATLGTTRLIDNMAA